MPPRAEHLGQPDVVAAAYAAAVRSQVAILTALTEQITAMQGQVEAHFGCHPAAEIIESQPGLGSILGARVLAEFGDDPHRYHDAKARKNYAGTSPITRASGKKKVVLARFVHNHYRSRARSTVSSHVGCAGVKESSWVPHDAFHPRHTVHQS